MDYAVVEDGLITNVIVIDDPKYADAFHALPLKEGQGIGDRYEAPEEISETDKKLSELESRIDSLADAIIQ